MFGNSPFFTEDWSKPAEKPYKHTEETCEYTEKDTMSPATTTPFGLYAAGANVFNYYALPPITAIQSLPLANFSTITVNGQTLTCSLVETTLLTAFDLTYTANAEQMAMNRILNNSNVQQELQTILTHPANVKLGMYKESDTHTNAVTFHFAIYKR